jgi:Flp pilus assembly protein TadD/peroxiredoxin
MAFRKPESNLSRRTFLSGMCWAPMLFLPAPLRGALSRPPFPLFPSSLPLSDFRIVPHYPANSPLQAMFGLVSPGNDAYESEKYAFEIAALLRQWGQALCSSPPALDLLATLLHPSIEAGSLVPEEETRLRSKYGIHVFRRRFSGELAAGREHFLGRVKSYFASFAKVETALFEITQIQEIASAPLQVRVEIRYDLVAGTGKTSREERVGYWQTEWWRSQDGSWRARKWQGTEETLSRAGEPMFVEITAQLLGNVPSYRSQLLRAVDYWRTVLDGASGMDIYGNSGIAAGDFDGDGLDDLYICQPAGLPNRLYRNRGDGSFEDVTKTAGVGALDATSCALFADFDNKGAPDLLVVTNAGPLLFVNQGNGKFSLKREAFKFRRLPEGTFTHAALADYDHDGRLDVYFCLYNYYAGLDQYRYPAPYFDARNGPPNFLFHNSGNADFEDRTEAAGLNADNNRYSFACAWGDFNSNGWPDLYVANDFGRSNLYRNNGDGTFTSAAKEAGVEDVGAGMSACWLDFDGDGAQDIYVANMWSAAGLRISGQPIFHQEDPEEIRALYRRHARGNSLYKNHGDGKFSNVSRQTGTEMGRWAWSSDSWDFDHDGCPDLYIANGYISGPQQPDLASFFWRQVVGNSPRSFAPSPDYEHGWNAINELIRSDSRWNGFERNVLYLNNGDGTFSEISGVAGLDLPDDSRAFALADLDHDGRLEIILKNRNGPQLRILRNAMRDIGNAVAFRLRGTRSNRDAIGTAITVEAGGRRQTKYLQAGSGFLSQHTKELFFGVGTTEGAVRATIHWPSGLTQTLDHLPVNQRIEVVEGSEGFQSRPFATSGLPYASVAATEKTDSSLSLVETWLIEPLSAPDFSLPDTTGKTWDLRSLRGNQVLLSFWAQASGPAREQLRLLRQQKSRLGRLQVLAVNVDSPQDPSAASSFARKEALPFPVLLADAEFSGTYNIVYRYLFDRHRDLGVPTSFLLDEGGEIVKVYQGVVSGGQLQEDMKSVPRTPAERVQKALPFEGTLYLGAFERNDFTYGVAFFQHGYLDQAAESFRQVIAGKPDDPEACYNLGTLYLRKNDLNQARHYLEQTVKLKPNYPEAWNNLGMLAAQQGQPEEAVRNFRQALALRPDYAIALVNLGNLYRREKSFLEAGKLLSRALQLQPADPEVNYSLGMLYAQQDQIEPAQQYLRQAIQLRPGYADALNNLGVLLVREQQYAEAKSEFQTCIRANPNFDQAYLNLARLYVILNDKPKAKAALEELLRQQPEHKMARQLLEMLQ